MHSHDRNYYHRENYVLGKCGAEDSNVIDLHWYRNQRSKSSAVSTMCFVIIIIHTSFLLTQLIGTKTAGRKRVLCMYSVPAVNFKHLDKFLCIINRNTYTLPQEKHDTEVLFLEFLSLMKKIIPTCTA